MWLSGGEKNTLQREEKILYCLDLRCEKHSEYIKAYHEKLWQEISVEFLWLQFSTLYFINIYPTL